MSAIKLENRIEFLTKCKKQKVIPSFLFLKVPFYKNRRGQRILRKASLLLLNERISDARKEKRRKEKECKRRITRLRKVGGGEVNRVLASIEKRQARKKRVANTKLCKKFQNLKSKQTKVDRSRGNQTEKKTVINLSHRTLTNTEQSVLERGLNYAIAPHKIPKFEIIKSIETAAVRLAPEKAEDYRAKIKQLIGNCRRLKSNVTDQEENAIQQLAKDKNIKTLRADKGDVTVVMDTNEYERKLTEMVSTEEYKKLEKDPTRAIEAKVQKSLKPVADDIRQNLRRLAPKHTKAPHLYGLPKVHKEGYPLRAIVSGIGSPCHNLARFLLNIISPLAGKSNSHINNSMDFIEQLKGVKLERDDKMVSFDVVNLFTSVPRTEAMKELRDRLERDHKLLDRTVLGVEKLMDLINLCLDTTYFQLGDHYYEQQRGLAMGSPLSPILADLYMEKMEREIMDKGKEKIKFWKRYVDDVFAIIQGDGDPEEILHQANSISLTVKFTLEQEKDGSLPFLDIVITRRENQLETSVYRKKTDSGRYLHYDSNHPRSVKVGVANCLLNRATTHCSTQGDKRREQEQVKSTLRSNGYPDSVFNEINRRSQHKKEGEKKEFKDLVVIPYVSGLSEAIRRAGDAVGIKTVFSAGDTLKKRLTHVKPKSTNREKEVIYKIPCECGAKYIGETGRPLEIRVGEHRRNWIKLNNENERGDKKEENISSLLAVHAVDNNHQVKWEDVSVLAKESNTKKRKIHEAAAIYIEENVISQPSHEIPLLWRSVLKEEKREIIRERKPKREERMKEHTGNRGERKRGREGEQQEDKEKAKRVALDSRDRETSLVDRRLQHRMKLRQRTRRPVRLIENM